MKRLEVEALSETVNCPVIQFPGRQFPGVVIQGDSLRILLDHVEEIHGLAATYKNDDLEAAVAHLKLILSGYVDEYEAVMEAHGRSLPYSK